MTNPLYFSFLVKGDLFRFLPSALGAVQTRPLFTMGKLRFSWCIAFLVSLAERRKCGLGHLRWPTGCDRALRNYNAPGNVWFFGLAAHHITSHIPVISTANQMQTTASPCFSPLLIVHPLTSLANVRSMARMVDFIDDSIMSISEPSAIALWKDARA